jgi:glycosidase
MKKIGLLHRAKSEYAYVYDKDSLHILIRTAKNDLKKIELIYGDPFNWQKNSELKYIWKHQISEMTKRYQTDLFDFYFIEIKPEQKRVKYAFILHDDEDIYLYGTRHLIKLKNHDDLYQQYDLSNYFNFPYMHEIDGFHTPAWVKDIVWYQIFPDRFNAINAKSDLAWGKLPVKNNELYGGNIKGIIDKIPYLVDLGFTGIYFTPIFESPSAHKYDTTNYFKIDPQFGTLEDFKLLVKTAHASHIKIMLDGVFNHVGFQHEFFQDVIKNNEQSIYKDCFYIDRYPVIDPSKKTLNYKAFAFAKTMPKWRTEDPLAEKHLLDVVKYWIKECDIDGWRLDVSNEVSHDFLRKLKIAARETKKDVFILGENMDDSSPWLQGDQLDATMNYDFSYPTWAYFEEKISLQEFKDTVTTFLAKTPKHTLSHMFNLVGSHDTIRIKTRLHEDMRRNKLIHLWMFASAGNPNIYYGDEIGMSGQQDPDNRRCMLWNEKDQDLDFKNFIKTLIKLRKTYPAFKASDYHFINLNLLAFTKTHKNETILFLLNEKNRQSVNLPKKLHGTYINLFTNKKLEIHDKITLESYEYLVLLKGENI